MARPPIDLSNLGDPDHRWGRDPEPRPPIPVDTSNLLPVDPPPEPEPPPPPVVTGPAASDVLELRRLYHERAARRMEALRLYEPLPVQAAFHECRSHTRLVRGSNRSGKTLSTSVEVSRAVSGQDPFGKYPTHNGRCYIVGYDEKELGEVIYRKLFKPNAFRIIRDAATGMWRAYRPWESADKIREKETKPAPPLIPKRFVQSIAWRQKSTSVPEKVVLVNGWELDFFSSKAKPPRGSDLDLVWFDEEIDEKDWFPEMAARLIDRRGRFVWGATPQSGTDQLYELHLRCEAEYEAWQRGGMVPADEPDAREFFALMKDNPHFDEDQRKRFVANLNDAQIAVRVDGDFAVEAARVYPEFSDRIHGLPYFDVPMDWTRFAVIDPGRQVCAVLFAACPPPDADFPIALDLLGDAIRVRANADPYVVLYDELYIHHCDAERFGALMAQKCLGQQFKAFVIDRRGSRSTEMGSGKTVEQQYTAALERHRVESIDTRSAFAWGSDDVEGGVEAVRQLLHVRPNGRPTLLCVQPRDRLPNLKHEIERYRYKRSKDGPEDKPEDRGRVHLMACLRYLAAYQPRYHEPPAGRARPVGAYESFRRRQKAKKKRDGHGAVNLGPGS